MNKKQQRQQKMLRQQEIVNAADVLTHLTATELVYLIDKSIEEITVVADNDYRSVEILYSVLENIL